MSNPEFNDDIYLQMVRAQSNSMCGNVESVRQNQLAANSLTPRPSKLELAKKWLNDNGGAHPGCLDRFMQARGMSCKS